MKRFTPEGVFREVRARGVTGLEMSGGTANVLRASGAKEDLIAFLIPDDKIPTIPLVAPYQTAPLKRAQEYDPAADQGWVKITAELAPNSQTEFIFKHTALFLKTVQGAEPKDIQAYFNKPAPSNKTSEFVDIECGLEDPDLACGQEVRDDKRGTWVRSAVPKKGKNKNVSGRVHLCRSRRRRTRWFSDCRCQSGKDRPKIFPVSSVASVRCTQAPGAYLGRQALTSDGQP